MFSTEIPALILYPLLAGGLGIFASISVVLYNLFLHPLRSYPGPWFGKATILWSQYHRFQGDLTFQVKKLHEKYGPVIRISPDELVFIDAQAWRDIYGFHTGVPENEKLPSNTPDFDLEHPSLGTAPREQHSKLRRLLSHAFSDKSMKEQEHIIKSYIDLLIERLHEKASECDPNGIDIVRWYNFTTFDIIGHLAFAESFGCLRDSKYHPWIEFVFATIKFVTMLGALMRAAPWLVKLIQIAIPARVRKQRDDFWDMTGELVQRRRAVKPTYTDFMQHLLEAERAGKLDADDVRAQAPLLVLAGSETTATLLSGVTYLLLTNPRVYERVKAEVRRHFSSQAEINLANIGALKYLLACFDEGLRMYPPAASNLPRRAPPQGVVVLGKWVPGGTVIGIHQLAAYRSAYNFAEPDVFAPERFIDAEDPRWANDKREVLQPFSFGPRNCIGRNLAYVEMRLILASILWNFDLELVSRYGDWFDQKLFASWEKNPLMVRLIPVKR